MDTKFSQNDIKVLGLKSDIYAVGKYNINSAAMSNPEEGEGWFNETYKSLNLYNGTLWKTLLQCYVIPKIADYTISIYECDGRYFTNEGSSGLVTFTLPSVSSNLIVDFIVQDSDSTGGIKIVPASGDTIRIGGSTSATGIQGDDISAQIRLIGISTSEWIGIMKSSLTFTLL